MWPTGASQYATINNIILPVFLRYAQLSAVHDHHSTFPGKLPWSGDDFAVGIFGEHASKGSRRFITDIVQYMDDDKSSKATAAVPVAAATASASASSPSRTLSKDPQTWMPVELPAFILHGVILQHSDYWGEAILEDIEGIVRQPCVISVHRCQHSQEGHVSRANCASGGSYQARWYTETIIRCPLLAPSLPRSTFGTSVYPSSSCEACQTR